MSVVLRNSLGHALPVDLDFGYRRQVHANVAARGEINLGSQFHLTYAEVVANAKVRAMMDAGQIVIAEEPTEDAVAGAELQVRSTETGIGGLITMEFDCPSGGATGTADDVELAAADTIPFDFTIVDVITSWSTAGAGGSTATLRTLPAAGGTALSSAMSTAAQAKARDAGVVGGAPDVEANTGLYLRRTDRSAVGTCTILMVRTS